MHLLTETVRPEWVDYNGHLNDGFYAVVFSRAIDAFVDAIGLPDEVRKATMRTVYTLETHVRFLDEVRLGAALAVSAQVLEVDAKRVRVFLQMHATESGALAATSEQLLMAIDQSGEAPRASEWPGETAAILARLAAADAGRPTPKHAGRGIAIKR